MVKFRGKPKPKKAAAPAQPEVHAYSAPKRLRLPSVHPFKGLRRSVKLVILGGVAAIAVVLVIAFVLNSGGDPTNGGKGLILNEKQAYAGKLSSAEAKKPAESATNSEKVAYYKNLSRLRANVEDYRGAIEAFNQAEGISDESFTYFDYVRLAQYYHSVNDDTSAQLALTRAYNVLPADDDERTGYFKSDVAASIEQLRKEYAE